MPDLSLSSPMLAPVEADGISLNIPGVGDGDHHILFRDQVFDANLRGDIDDLRSSLVSEGVSDGEQFFLDHVELQPFAFKDRLQSIDQLDSLLILLDDLALFKVGEPLEPHLQNGLGLFIGEAKSFDQAFFGLFGGLRRPESRR